ncbi:MAG: phage holin family protein [Saprospiraceae bacterium]|nr:phage holin family protein [Saprospiraceae bacterium]
MLNDVNRFIEDILGSTEDVQESIELRKKLIQLQITQSIARLTSWLSVSLIAIFIFFSMLFFVMVALAIWLGQYMNDYALAFLVVAVVYAIIGLIGFLFARNKLKDWTTNYIIKFMLT